MIGLTILDRMGLKWFQDLPVLAFAVPPGANERTPLLVPLAARLPSA